MSNKGRLYLNRTYLAGAMDRVPDGGEQWRQWLTPWLNSRGVVVLDPSSKPCNIGKEDSVTRAIRHNAKLKGDYGPLLADKVVRSVDLRMVDISDFVIVKLDLDVHPCGTYEELFLGNREKKPILVMCDQGKNQAPDWLWWTIPHEMIFGNWDDMKAYIDHINTSPGVDTLKRWIFFDLTKVTQDAIDGYCES